MRDKFREIIGDPHPIEKGWLAWNYVKDWPDYSASWEELYTYGIKTFTDGEKKNEIFQNIVGKFNRLAEEIEDDMDNLVELYKIMLQK